MKKNCRFTLSSGLVLAGMLGSALLPASAKTAVMAPKMSSSKMSSTKMSSNSKMTQMTGTILSMTAHSLTVKPALKSNGMKKTVIIPSSAKIMMGAVPTSLSKLKAGEKVTIMMNRGAVTSVRVVAANKTVAGKMMKSKMAPKMAPKMAAKKKM